MIDIIIPAYNAHATIENTLLSILTQTIKDKVKVYIIDDCSRKTYGSIVNMFKNKLDISLIRLDKNSGPGNARNVGITKSSNPYILFLDADDELYNSFSLELLLRYIDDYDMCFGGIYQEIEDNKLAYFIEHEGCLHGKLYKRSLIDKYNIRFTDTKYSEDNYFNQLYISLSDNIYNTNEPIYVYKYTSDSLTKDKEDSIIYYYNHNMSLLLDKCEELNISTYKITRILLSTLCYNYQEYMNSNMSNDIYVKYPKDMIIKYYNIYKEFISDCDIKSMLEEYKNYNLAKISFIEYVNLLCN